MIAVDDPSLCEDLYPRWKRNFGHNARCGDDVRLPNTGAFKVGAGTVLHGGYFGPGFQVDVDGHLGTSINAEAYVKLGKHICVEDGVSLRKDPKLEGDHLAVRLARYGYIVVPPTSGYYFDLVDGKCVQKDK